MSQSAYPAVVALGAVSGMRTMLAPSTISWAARRSGLEIDKNPTGWKTSLALTAGEMLADQIPFVANHAEGAFLIARAVSGATAGAAVCKAKHRSVALGALVGAAAAIGMTLGAYHLRKKAARRFRISERAIALAEDGIALAIGLVVVMSLKPGKTEAIAAALKPQ